MSSSDTSSILTEPSKEVVPAAVPAAALPAILLTILYTQGDSETRIVIQNKQCVITEYYIDEFNKPTKQSMTIALKKLATYLFTHISAACLDDHRSWQSVQFMCSLLPDMFIYRHNLEEKRTLIIQTLISHIENLQ